jgi:hypothetical protein
MKERFSEGEWQEIKPIPAFMVVLVVSSAPATKNNALKLYIDTIYDPSKISDPLLKMMFIDLQIEMNEKSGDMNPLGALTGLNKVQSSDAISGILSGVKPESMVMIENALNPEEFREFLRGLFQFTMKMVYVGGKPKPDQMKLIMDFFMTFVSSEQELMAIFNDASL